MAYLGDGASLLKQSVGPEARGACELGPLPPDFLGQERTLGFTSATAFRALSGGQHDAERLSCV